MKKVKDTGKNRRKFLSRTGSRRGFTLAELLMVVAIIGILASIAFIGIFAYRRHLKRLELDETAQEIYVVAQNHLAQEEESGSLPDKPENTLAAGAVDTFWGTWAEVTEEDGSTRKLCLIAHGSGENYHSDKPDTILDYMLPAGAIDETVSTGGQYIIAYDPESLQVYEVFYTDAAKSKFELNWAELNSGAYRKDKNARESYAGKTGNIIGYYGGDGLSFRQLSLERVSLNVTNGNRLAAVITYPIKNKASSADLSVNLTVKGKSSLAEKTIQVGTIRINSYNTYSVDTDSALADGFQASAFNMSHSIAKTKLCGFRLVLDDITRADGHFSELFASSNKDGNSAAFIPGEDLELYAYLTQNGAPVSGQESNHVVMNSLFADVKLEEAGDEGETGKAEVAEISSIRHLENLDPAISGLATDHSSDVIYSYDADGNIAGRKAGNAAVDRSDELLNSLKDFQAESFCHITKARQVSDLYWSQGPEANDRVAIQDADSKDAEKANVLPFYAVETITSSDKEDDLFADSTTNGVVRLNKSAAQLKQADRNSENSAVNVGFIGIYNSALSSYDGTGLKIYNLTGRVLNMEEETAFNNAGLFRLIDQPMTISRLSMVRSAFNAGESAGNTAHPGNAGSLCAESRAALTIDSCFVSGTVRTDKSKVDEQQRSYAGGLVGVSNNELHITDSGVYAEKPVNGTDYRSSYYASYTEVQNQKPVIGNTYIPSVYAAGSNAKAGGLVGYILRTRNSDFKDGGRKEVTIENSFASVSVGTNYSPLINKKNSDENECAGGLIGAVNNSTSTLNLTIKNSYAGGMTSPSDPGVYSEAVPNVTAPFAGGVIGYFYAGEVSCSIHTTYTTAAVSNPAGIDEGKESGIGGLIGYVTQERRTSILLDTVYSTGAVYNTSGIDSAKIGSFIGSLPEEKNLKKANNTTLAGSLEGVNESCRPIGSPENIAVKYSVNKSDITVNNSASVYTRPYSRGANEICPYSGWTKTNPIESEKDKNSHFGDWPDAEDSDNLYGFIYYEKIQGDPTLYYHGYMIENDPADPSYKAATYTEIKTPESNANGTLNSSGLLVDHGKYVSESGYILLVKNDIVRSDYRAGFYQVSDFDNMSPDNTFLQNETTLDNLFPTEYSSLLNGSSIKGYKAYLYDPATTASYILQASQQGNVLAISKKINPYDSHKDPINTVFTFHPFISDSVKAPDANGKVQPLGCGNENGKTIVGIRSAQDLNTLLNFESGKYGISPTFMMGNFIIEQQLDITFDPDKVTFTHAGEAVSSSAYINNTFSSISANSEFRSARQDVGINPNDPEYKKIYCLDSLSRPIADLNNGKIYSLYVTNSYITGNASHDNQSSIGGIISQNGNGSNAQVEDITVENSWMTGAGLVGFNFRGAKIQNCNLFKVVMGSNGLADTNAGNINDCIINHAAISKNGFTASSTGTIKNCQIMDSNIGADGFTNSIEGGSIENCEVSGSDIGKNGFAGNVKGGSLNNCIVTSCSVAANGFAENVASGTIDSCNVSNSGIGQNGFAGAVTAAVQNCKILNSGINGNGFAGSVSGNGNVTNCDIINARIGENGFAGAVNDWGEIKDCQIYGDKGQYQESRYYSYSDAFTDPALLDTFNDDPDSYTKGYSLVSIGLKSSTDSETDCAGFVGSIEYATIENCSVTGNIYGTDIAGFVSENTGTIRNSYSNVYASGETVSGFCWNNGGGIIFNCAALGKLVADHSAYGFAVNLRQNNAFNSTILDSYSAIWSVTIGNQDGDCYYPFCNQTADQDYQIGQNLSNDCYLKGLILNRDALVDNAIFAGKSYSELKTDKIVDTAAYNQYYNNGHSYPYPLADGMTFYGDWMEEPEITLNLLYQQPDGTGDWNTAWSVQGKMGSVVEIPQVHTDFTGYQFDGWYSVNADGEMGKGYQEGENYTFSDSAYLTPDSVQVYLYGNYKKIQTDDTGSETQTEIETEQEAPESQNANTGTSENKSEAEPSDTKPESSDTEKSTADRI